MRYAVQWWYKRPGGTCRTSFDDREEAMGCFARMLQRPPIPGDPLSVIEALSLTETTGDQTVVLVAYNATGLPKS